MLTDRTTAPSISPPSGLPFRSTRLRPAMGRRLARLDFFMAMSESSEMRREEPIRLRTVLYQLSRGLLLACAHFRSDERLACRWVAGKRDARPTQLSLSLLFSCATFWVAGEA